jgi:hypothetical protein
LCLARGGKDPCIFGSRNTLNSGLNRRKTLIFISCVVVAQHFGTIQLGRASAGWLVRIILKAEDMVNDWYCGDIAGTAAVTPLSTRFWLGEYTTA